MPNHYDTDVYCKNCKRYIFSFLYDHEDDGQRFCCDKCENEYNNKQKDQNDGSVKA